jgi:multicomponent Na+:H+ antiporter subunit E
MRRSAVCFLAVLALWLLLFWRLDWSVVLAGAAFSVLVTASLGPRFPAGIEKVLDLRRWFFAALYLPYFLFYCIKANLDVAVRVIHPDVPIRPGIVKVRTNLTSEMAKTFLANSITLTPGTLTIDIDGQDLYVHWINIKVEDPEKRFAEIVGRFEPLLRRIFE